MRASVVINTDGRAAGLRAVLDNLRYLEHAEFEVCVVHGPTPDGTAELVAAWQGRIKSAPCPLKNLSMSRNIGIALASGEIVAFIDDDALAEPEWLSDIVAAFAEPEVGAAGGLVYDHRGRDFQYRYASANRLGAADWRRSTPAEEFNFPLSDSFPYVQGTNSAFRRTALLAIGGFDEEIEYYLDETDVCCRLVDAGWIVRQLPRAYVHHKFLPSSIRNEHRVVLHRYPILKNKIYFSFKNNKGHYTAEEAIRDALAFTEEHRRDVAQHVAAGRAPPEALEIFEEEAARAWQHGLAVAMAQEVRGLTTAMLACHASPFLPFPRLCPEGERRTYCFLSWDYPPGHAGGIARYTEQVAHAVAALGHHVHVVTRTPDVERVDVERGVWVHRVALLDPPPAAPAGAPVPAQLWHVAATMLAEVERIDAHRSITCVEAPIWDVEGCAILRDGRFPLVTSLHTTLAQWLGSHPAQAGDAGYMRRFGRPVLALEREMIARADGIHANSEAIIAAIEADHGIAIDRARTAVIPHGMEDIAHGVTPAPRQGDTIEILFVGRLEERKGIDVLLAAAELVLPQAAEARFVIVGDDSLPGPDGATYRAAFERRHRDDALAGAVTFLGKIGDAELLARYAAADIFVCPSRFESFGLIALEAMIFARPVIAGQAGGLAEIIADGATGLLVPPGDAAALAAAILRLVREPALRQRLGNAGRAAYLQRFTARRMGEAVADFLARFARRAVADEAVRIVGASQLMELHGAGQGRMLAAGARLEIAAEPGRCFLTFWAHDWSGFAAIAVDGRPVQRLDLYAPRGLFRTVEIELAAPAVIAVTRGGRSQPVARDDQVIFYRMCVAPLAASQAEVPAAMEPAGPW